MTAREVALHVVRDVFPQSGSQRSAQQSLDYRARSAKLDARDRAFATELAYGAIKMRRALDWYLQPFIGERAATLAPTVREVLRLAVYELRYTRADEHATVYEFVEIAKRHGHRGLAALVNAVLRSYLREPPPDPSPASFDDEDEYVGTVQSLPTWLVRQWRRVFGSARLDAICTGVNAPPQTATTVWDGRPKPEGSTQSAFVPESYIVATGAALHEGARDGSWWLQSESSAMPVEILKPHPGERVLDLCSGRGNKALQIAARLGGDGALVCVDRDERRMRILEDRFETLGAQVSPVVADAGAFEPATRFDRVLLDAPCSGTGVVGRHPEARWKKQPGDGERLAPVQGALLAAAASLLYEGGVLVYAVCSTDPREGIEVVNAFLAQHSFGRGLVPAQFEPHLTSDGDVLVPPGIDGRDGFFVARLERSL